MLLKTVVTGHKIQFTIRGHCRSFGACVYPYKSVGGQNAARVIPVGSKVTKQLLRVAGTSFTRGVALEGTVWVRVQLAATGTHTDGLD